MTEGEDARTAAIERIRARRSFVPHALCYVVVNAVLVGIWATTGAGYFWPIWVMGGWGVGLLMHGYTAFLQKPITEQDVEEELRRGGPAVS